MYSMTGYGKGEYGESGLTVSVEVKSVNNRYLDVAVKSPRILLCAEESVRATVREYLSRGHLDVFISYSDKRERAKSLYVDWGVIHAYMEAAAEIKEAYPLLEDDGSLSFFLRLPDAIRSARSRTSRSPKSVGISRSSDRTPSGIRFSRRNSSSSA